MPQLQRFGVRTITPGQEPPDRNPRIITPGQFPPHIDSAVIVPWLRLWTVKGLRCADEQTNHSRYSE